MKGRLGNPSFPVRLEAHQEKTLISLASDFQQNSYAKTLVAVAMTYESDKRNLKQANDVLKKQLSEITAKYNAEKKYNTLITSKLILFKKLVGKVVDIKKPLDQLARIAGSRSK